MDEFTSADGKRRSVGGWIEKLYKMNQEGTAAPTTGKHYAGEKVWNTAPSAGGTAGWICVTSGTPGTWKTFGQVSA